jgi:FKBP-type peptidyl-prolyl cis-trans isomerase
MVAATCLVLYAVWLYAVTRGVYHKPAMKNSIRIAAGAAMALALSTLAMPVVRAQGVPGHMTEMEGGLKYTDTQVGTGKIATAGHQVTVNYTGWLYENGVKGKKFDSSLDRAQPFSFNLGGGQVIKGWDEGVAGMKVGGKRTLIIPPGLAYGAKGAGGVIPPFATLMFDVELLKVD